MGTATPASPDSTPASTPTVDRLARPTLPSTPSQADLGAQVYWLYCLPCHGDKGQGLTDEFRLTYPVEEQYCWDSGCHGKRPYENGWTLPNTVPALIGPGALTHFPNAQAVYNFARAAMPFQDPGVMSDEQYWQVTAFLLRENGLWNGRGQIDQFNAAQIVVNSQQTPTPAAASQTTENASGRIQLWGAAAAAGLALLFWLLRSLAKRTGG